MSNEKISAKEKINTAILDFSGSVKANRKDFMFCIISAFVWGLVAHAYMFFHSSFSHDSLNEFNVDGFGNEMRIQYGRVFVPAYRTLSRGFLALPWLIGLLALFYIGLAVFLTVKLFSVKSKPLTVLIAGVYTANLTVTALTATYIHDLDCDMMAMLLAVIAVYVWQRYKWGFVFGVIPICLSLGLYQSFVSVAITLTVISLIMQLFDGKKAKSVIVDGIKGSGMLVGGGILYGLSIKAVCVITGIPLVHNMYNSVTNIFSLSVTGIFQSAINCYKNFARVLLTATSVYDTKIVSLVNIAVLVLCGIIILISLLNKKIGVLEKLLAVALIAVLPIGMDFSNIFAGYSYTLMHYGIWITYIFVLLVAFKSVKHLPKMPNIVKYGQCILSVGAILVILWGNVLTANTVYLKKDFEDKANLSALTRILHKIENYDGYVSGETPVVFVGRPTGIISKIDGFERAYEVSGAESPYVIGTERSYYESYFENVLLNTIKLADEEIWISVRASDDAKKMPSYPDDGCIQIMDGVMVVRLGKYYFK